MSKNAAFAKADNFKFPLWSDLGRELGMYYGAATTPKQGAADRITVILNDKGEQIVEYGSFVVNSTLGAHPKNVLKDCQAILGK